MYVIYIQLHTRETVLQLYSTLSLSCIVAYILDGSRLLSFLATTDQPVLGKKCYNKNKNFNTFRFLDKFYTSLLTKRS